MHRCFRSSAFVVSATIPALAGVTTGGEDSRRNRLDLGRPLTLAIAARSAAEPSCRPDSFCGIPFLPYKKDMQSPISANRANTGSKPSVPLPQEILDIKAAANYLGVSRSHLSHMLAGKIPGLPAIPHVRAGRRALIRRAVIDDWLLQQEHGPAVEVAR